MQRLECKHSSAYGADVASVVKKAAGKPSLDVGLRSFSGSVATTGNSRGLRLEKAFFKAAPEFASAGSAIRADLIGPGTILVRIDAPQQEAEDPVIGAWLSFMDRDMQSNPGRLVPLQEGELTALETLVEGVSADDDFELPKDVSF